MYIYKMKFLGMAIAFGCFLVPENDCYRYKYGVKETDVALKIQELKDIVQRKMVVTFNGPKFKDLVKYTGRSYDIIIMYTAMSPQRQCTICKMVYDEYVVMVRSFYTKHGIVDKIFFGIVDFDEGPDVFQMMKVQTAPVIMYMPAKRSAKNDILDMQRIGFSAEIVARWVSEKTGLDFKVFRVPNYELTFGIVILIFMIVVGLYFRPEHLHLLSHSGVWGSMAILFCICMTSGQMWNHIRSPPFYHKVGNNINYVHSSSQGQFISESYIILILSGLFVVCAIIIIEFGLYVPPHPSTAQTRWRHKIFEYVGMVCFAAAVLLYSGILYIFRTKAVGYPYKGLF